MTIRIMLSNWEVVALVLVKNPRAFLDRFSHEKLERNTRNRANRKRRRALGRRKKHGRP